MLKAVLALPAGLPAHLGQQVRTIGTEIVVQELVHMRIVVVADRIAAVGRHLAEAVEIQLADEARDVAGLEDGPARVQVLGLESLVIQQHGVAVRAPSYRPALALVHDSPELLRESHRLQHAVLVHLRSRRRRRRLENDLFTAARPPETESDLIENVFERRQRRVLSPVPFSTRVRHAAPLLFSKRRPGQAAFENKRLSYHGDNDPPR